MNDKRPPIVRAGFWLALAFLAPLAVAYVALHEKGVL